MLTLVIYNMLHHLVRMTLKHMNGTTNTANSTILHVLVMSEVLTETEKKVASFALLMTNYITVYHLVGMTLKHMDGTTNTTKSTTSSVLVMS